MGGSEELSPAGQGKMSVLSRPSEYKGFMDLGKGTKTKAECCPGADRALWGVSGFVLRRWFRIKLYSIGH
eukprot:7739372-Heterocapsa_arctica.AAC.1